MTWKNMLIEYFNTGKVSKCPICGGPNITIEKMHFGRESINFICSDCNFYLHADGVRNKTVTIEQSDIKFLLKHGIDIRPFVERDNYDKMLEYIYNKVINNIQGNNGELNRADLRIQEVYDKLKYEINEAEEYNRNLREEYGDED